jgi:hypothetical protein
MKNDTLTLVKHEDGLYVWHDAKPTLSEKIADLLCFAAIILCIALMMHY